MKVNEPTSRRHNILAIWLREDDEIKMSQIVSKNKTISTDSLTLLKSMFDVAHATQNLQLYKQDGLICSYILQVSTTDNLNLLGERHDINSVFCSIYAKNKLISKKCNWMYVCCDWTRYKYWGWHAYEENNRLRITLCFI